MSSNMEVIKIGKHEYTVLFPDLLREHTERELVALRKSIRLRGVEVAVVVDENGGVIDGINRLRVAAELGLGNVPTDVRVGLSEEQKIKLCCELNDSRRHMTPAEREKLKKDRDEQLQRIKKSHAEGKSVRVIAQEEGIHPKQVQRDLESVDVAGCKGVDMSTPLHPPVKVTGADGKTYPAKNDAAAIAERTEIIQQKLAEGKTASQVAEEVGVSRQTVQAAKKRAPAIVEEDDTDEPEQIATPSTRVIIMPSGETVQGGANGKVLRDEFGIPIQEHAREAFEARERHDELIKLLKQARLLLSEIVDGPSGTHLRKMVNWSRKPTKDKPDAGIWQMAELENAITNIQITRPAMTDCPYVYSQYHTHSDECRYCYGSRWCPSIKHRTCPEEHIRAMKSHYGIASDTPEESEG